MWVLTSTSGEKLETPKQTISFSEDHLDWQEYTSQSLTIHWYDGSVEFAEILSLAGETVIQELFSTYGAVIEDHIDIYIYSDAKSMQQNTLFSPDWSGGIAFASHRTVLAGVSPDSISWGKEVVAHELTHVLIGLQTFSCVTNIPIWLNEGLAMYAESIVGTSHDYEQAVLEQAISENKLFSVKEISSIFSNDPDLAYLSYAQSFSLVNYLIEVYGQPQLIELLAQFKTGASQDSALEEVYGLNQVSLDRAWRQWIGAPEDDQSLEIETTPTRTPYPTIPPITLPLSTKTMAPTLPPTAEPIPTLPIQTATPELTPTPAKPVSIILTITGAIGLIVFAMLLALVLRARQKLT